MLCLGLLAVDVWFRGLTHLPRASHSGASGEPTRPDRVLAGHVDAATFERRFCGRGTKGERCYDWAMWRPRSKARTGPGLAHTLLIRRSIGDPSQIEFFLAHAPHGTPAPKLIQVAGMRRNIEENNGQGKDLLGPVPGPQMGSHLAARHRRDAGPGVPRWDTRRPGKRHPVAGKPRTPEVADLPEIWNLAC